jgi:hypothetical protein
MMLVEWTRTGGIMRVLLILAMAAIPAAAQSPLVLLFNTSNSGKAFQIGDGFEVRITGAPNQLISVRTSMHGRTDWGPVIGSTDSTGRWSTAGKFEKSDLGDWSELWTVGGKLVSPAIQFSVGAPCLPGGQNFAFTSGPNWSMSCETAEGHQIFSSPSLPDPFRTPDGRLVPGRAASETQEQYHMGILQDLMANGMGASRVALQSSRGGLGDETAGLISQLIGVNALSESETRNVVAIVRAAFEKPETIAPSAKIPSKTLLLLRNIEQFATEERLKQKIAETIAYFQAQ